MGTINLLEYNLEIYLNMVNFYNIGIYMNYFFSLNSKLYLLTDRYRNALKLSGNYCSSSNKNMLQTSEPFLSVLNITLLNY